MVRRALAPAAAAFGVAVAAGYALSGAGAAAAAGIGIVLVTLNFAAHGLSLAWASRISIGAVMGVALGGLVLRMGVLVGAMFALNTTFWFSPLAFALAVVPATLLLLAFEARLVIGGVGAALEIPADAAAVRAAATLASKENA